MDSFQQASDTGNPILPQFVNTSSQIFGANDHDISPTAPNFPFEHYGDDLNEGPDDRDDAKRRRIAKVFWHLTHYCYDVDGHNPGLRYVPEEEDQIAKYIEGLENRLGRMEALLKLSGLLSDEDVDRTDLSMLEKRLVDKTTARSNSSTPSDTPQSQRGSQPPPSANSGSLLSPASANKLPTPQSMSNSPQPAEETNREEEVEALSDMMCSLVTNNCGETRYIGSSSGFSIFSPKGIQWINEKTGDTSFQEMITMAAADDTKWVYWRPEIFGDLFSRRTFMPVPPKQEALSLCKDYFENFNCMFPLFHEPTFMHLVEKQYSRQPYDGSGWWASFNIALAIAHRLRVMNNLVPQEEDNKAWMYLKNAMGVLTELTMRNLDLLSVQALLGMAMFLMGTPNPQPSFFLVAAAIRLANSIGLHKRGSGFNLNPVEIEQRKRVFWIAYLLDKDICLRSGRPPAQDDDDMNVELPSEDPIDNIGNIPLADGKGKTNLFRLMASFAVIESKVYKQLYSTKASKQSDGALLNTIGELDKELEEWKDAIPIDIRPEHEIKAAHPPLVLHIVVLHFAYYNCLTTIHLNFLSLLAITEEQGGIKRMLGLCIEFERIAKVVLEKAEKETHSRRKRKSNKEADQPSQAVNYMGQQPITLHTSTPQNPQHPSNPFSQGFASNPDLESFNSTLNGSFPPRDSGNTLAPLDFSSLMNAPAGFPPSVSGDEFQQLVSDGGSSFNMGSFQQPFVPQDFWQMPQTLEWDWADMGNVGYPGFDAGNAEVPHQQNDPNGD
ncbi:hypothetical protein Q9189_003339 [Teloschistes chrysophthalmus]